MKKSDIIILITVAAGIVIAWLLDENKSKSEKIEKLQKEIEENSNLTKEIRLRLTELIQNNKEVDPKIANELSQMVALLEIKQDTTAVSKLAKVIENLLKELYKEDKSVNDLAIKNGRKNPVFADYLQHAKNSNLVSSEDFHLLSVLKIIRNEDVHELDIHKEKSRILAAFIAGLGFVLMLCRLLNKRHLTNEKLN
jgi:type I site-specific restriction endonuclease